MNWLEISYGALATWPAVGVALAALVACLVLGFLGAPLWAWSLLLASLLWALAPATAVWAGFILLAVVFNVRPLRRALVSRATMAAMRRFGFLPRISDTERTAIEAGTVWIDRELFSGGPDFRRLVNEAYPDLTAEERAFLDGPVEEVCRMTDDWQVYRRRDLPAAVWERLKAERFFGMIIPKEYGGLGFSASANSAVVAKLASRSTPLSVSVMVPNSLGPAELLIHYGTPEQKEYWLPRLARGEEIPCFALTEPGAGSDAGAVASHGVVFRGEDGALYLRLNWNKRYITLAPIATVLGLAFRLRDPDGLLGKGPEPGITCALIPTSTPGVEIGRRHDPLGVPFYNGPTEGHDVVVPVDAIIGGAEGAGRGWQMLMESLAAGRGISLPASATGGTKALARVVGAYAAVRQQFGTSIGNFEGVQEPLARIGGFAYLLEAVRRFTNGGLDSGAKPAVVTAIVKYNTTELARRAVADAMDVVAGAAISLGPRNLVGHGWIGVPVSITVEGANILTRTLMVFGQGAIRSHPYAYAEIRAAEAGDVAAFDAAFWGHVGHVVRNLCRARLLGLTRGRLARAPVSGPAAAYWRKLAWTSARFALLADLAMGTLGGTLKRRGALTGRFADVFSWMYLLTALLVRFEREGRRAEDLPLLHWCARYGFARVQEAFEGIYENIEVPGLRWAFRGPIRWFARLNPIAAAPEDRLGRRVARLLQVPGEQRDRLTAGIYVPDDPQQALGRLERAFALSVRAAEVARKVKRAVRRGELPRARPERLADRAVAAGIITAEEAELLAAAEAAREDVIQVDSFTPEQYMATAERTAPVAVG